MSRAGFALTLGLLVALPVAAGEESTRTYTLESKAPLTVTLGLPATLKCNAEIALTYAQKNTDANVEGELNNADCAASSGEYTLAVSIRDANGATQTLEFNETWQRSDNQNLVFEKDFPIGENVDLLRVRTRRLSCTCAEAPEAPAVAE
jgi:hypothetical protein